MFYTLFKLTAFHNPVYHFYNKWLIREHFKKVFKYELLCSANTHSSYKIIVTFLILSYPSLIVR